MKKENTYNIYNYKIYSNIMPPKKIKNSQHPSPQPQKPNYTST